MTGKIFRTVMTVSCCVLLACTVILMGCLYDYFGNVQKSQLWDELDMAAAGVESSGLDYLSSLDSDSNRLTWIGADGAVLYDAEADEHTMENHSGREEVQEALRSGTGSSERYSKTLLEKTIYCAKRLPDGSVLRISVSQTTPAVLAMGMLQPICLIVLVAMAVAFWLASRLSKRIVEPLNGLDLDNPLDNNTYDELAPLLTRISQQRRQIDEQLRRMQQKKDEFDQITASMNEGLVLLDGKGVILSINPAAERLFNVGESSVGHDFLTAYRSSELSGAVSDAMSSGHSEVSLEIGRRAYQADISRIEYEDALIGVVVLIFDVTEKADAERARREFTANVSHELKTPLTAILGSSELLQNGMVRQEDVPRFLGHIHDEAARLLTLIEDIIRLSQLDEGVQPALESVDLSAAAHDAVAQLSEKAAQCKVCLNISTEPCLVRGIPALVHEIVYNLTENAIKYNVPDGSVTVSVTRGGILTVEDTGIGIPTEHRERIFERFYRVDKSHSKKIGGTGLGLSIVKHSCAYLGAGIELQSEVGKGTTVRISFDIAT